MTIQDGWGRAEGHGNARGAGEGVGRADGWGTDSVGAYAYGDGYATGMGHDMWRRSATGETYHLPGGRMHRGDGDGSGSG